MNSCQMQELEFWCNRTLSSFKDGTTASVCGSIFLTALYLTGRNDLRCTDFAFGFLT